jgi:hypothetical protein
MTPQQVAASHLIGYCLTNLLRQNIQFTSYSGVIKLAADNAAACMLRVYQEVLEPFAISGSSHWPENNRYNKFRK